MGKTGFTIAGVDKRENGIHTMYIFGHSAAFIANPAHHIYSDICVRYRQ